MIDLKKIEEYQKTFNWIELEKLYLNEILLFNSKIDTYYHLGMVQERLKKYDNAIASYNMATFRKNSQSENVYYRLGYVFDTIASYKEACGAFLMMKKILLSSKKPMEDKETVQAHRMILHNYIKGVKLFTLNHWKILGEKAEALKCWNIAEYGYKEYLARADDFEENIYFSLGYVLVCQKKYEEASYFFKEQKIIQSLNTPSTNSYEVYCQRFKLEDNLILYESKDDTDILDNLYNLFLLLEKNVKFDNYKHIWAVNNKDKIETKLKEKTNILFINKGSDLYLRYLARVKYFATNISFPSYFNLKDGQVLVQLDEKIMDLEKLIKSMFFITIDTNRKVVFQKKSLSDLEVAYALALDTFYSKEWKSSFEQFSLIQENIYNKHQMFPLLYYKRESELMYLKENQNENIEDNLSYFHHKFDAENFAGVEFLLNQAIDQSIENSNKWRLLKREFLSILEDIKITDDSLWTSIKGDGFIDKIKLLAKKIDDTLEANLLPYPIWFLFANLFIFARVYKKYQIVRTNARDSILSSNKVANNPFARYKINALLEVGREDEYCLLREELLQNNDLYIQKYLQLLGMSEYYFKNSAVNKDFYKDFFTEEEKRFASYIENKSIAIVGPLQSGMDVGEEIDGFDVVLRFNYNGLENFSKKEFGEKTSMSFYIAEILLKDKLDLKKVSYMNQLDWVIMDTPHNEEDICFLGLNTQIRKRYAAGHAFATSMLKGAPSGIQRVIMDLVRFDTGKIKVFNTNLFLQNNYVEAYRSRGKLGADDFNFFWHDPLSNFIFLQRLKHSHTIDADEVLSKILEMSETEYIDALELRYGSENSEDKS